MNKAIKTKWLKALRSGEYRQTRGKLKSRNGAYCCLGILCIIQGAKVEWYTGMDGYFFGDGLDKSDTLPPKNYVAEIKDFEPLTDRNDGAYNYNTGEQFHEHSFSEIADYIEENL